MIFGIGTDRIYSFQEIADYLKVTKGRIYCIKSNALTKLKRPATLKTFIKLKGIL